MRQRLKNVYHLFVAIAACFYYRFPAKNLKVVGVTGTDGKTTTANLIYQILKTAGYKPSLVSTVNLIICGQRLQADLHVTTPGPLKIQKLIRQVKDLGSQHLVLEVTSHALDQHRVFGIPFEVGVLTNATHEHLDYHRTYENYLATKAKLLQKARWAVVNRDDESYGKLKIKNKKSKMVTYGIKNRADIVASDVFLSPTLTRFLYRCMDTSLLGGKGVSVGVKTHLLGEFNVYNSLAAISCAKLLKIPDEKIKEALATFRPLPGRLEIVESAQPFKIIVDFAHTPNALRQILRTCRKTFSPKQLIHVFGCTGERDREKRPIMGEIAASLADFVVLTSEDSYLEDPEKIVLEIEPGVKKGGKVFKTNYWKFIDRQRAIDFAISLARSGDCVLITGMGHETTINLGGKEYPWSDKEAVLKALKNENVICDRCERRVRDGRGKKGCLS